MSDDQRKPQWLARWRAKGERKRQRRWWCNTGMDVDSDEKIAESHTSRGRERAAEDRRYRGNPGSGF